MYANDMVHYVHYWKQIYSEITHLIPVTPTMLQERFWLTTIWQWDHACSMLSGVRPDVSLDTIPKDDPKPYPYCGLPKVQPKPHFNSYLDDLLGDFVLCLPYNGHHLPMWLGCAILTIELSTDRNHGTFLIEWWTPICSKKEPKSLVARKY